MPHPKPSPLSRLLALTTLCLIFPVAATAQNGQSADQPAASADEPSVIRALLNEVTLLRMILQQTNFTGTHAQILVERIRVQQERVERLTRDLENIRDQIGETKLQQLKSAETLREVETQLSREQISARRNDLLLQQRLLRFEVEKFNQQEQRLRDREAQMAAQVRIEQSRLDELTDKLDTLERDLERQETPGRIQPKSRKP
jgi:chromosome segregation ATPase